MNPAVWEPVRVLVGLAVIIVVIPLVKKPATNLAIPLAQVQHIKYQHNYLFISKSFA